MRSLRLAAAVAALVSVAVHSLALGAEPPEPTLDAAGVQRVLPGFEVKNIRRVPLQGGLYEVIGDQGNVFYMDGAAGIGFQCDLYDVATRTNLTLDSISRFNKVEFAQLPLDLAITRVKGDGRRQIAVFADPDCPFCVKLEQELETVDNVTVHTFLYPIASLHPQAVDRSHRIWCSADRDVAWRDWLLHQREAAVAVEVCTSPLDEIARLAPKFRINATPGVIFQSGRVVNGLVSRPMLETYLDEPPLSASATPARVAP